MPVVHRQSWFCVLEIGLQVLLCLLKGLDVLAESLDVPLRGDVLVDADEGVNDGVGLLLANTAPLLKAAEGLSRERSHRTEVVFSTPLCTLHRGGSSITPRGMCSDRWYG